MNDFKHLSLQELIDLFSRQVDQYYELKANAASPTELKICRDGMSEFMYEINRRNSTVLFSQQKPASESESNRVA